MKQPSAPLGSGEPGFQSADLAPGDTRALGVPLEALRFDRVTGPDDPNFEIGYEMMRQAFSPGPGVRRREIFRARLGWDVLDVRKGVSNTYEMVVVTRNGQPIAMRDHATALFHGGQPAAVVHLLHVLVTTDFRRSGLAGWLRCYPVQAARSAAMEVGLPPALPIILATGMEHPVEGDDSRMIPLLAYEAGGFLKVDPARIDYLQPDPRPRDEVDRTGGPTPRRLALLLRRLQDSHSTVITGRELRRIVGAVHGMYDRVLRPGDMAPLHASLETYPADDEEVALLPPTARSK